MRILLLGYEEELGPAMTLNPEVLDNAKVSKPDSLKPKPLVSKHTLKH